MQRSLLVIILIAATRAQVPFFGRCPQKEVVQNFNVTKYLGKWYEQERYFAIFELGGDCVTATYTMNDDGSVGVLNKMTTLLTNSKSSINGRATLVGENGEAKLDVHFDSAGPFGAPYWILATDYDNYSIVWSCSYILGSNAQFAWVLTRQKNPGPEMKSQIKTMIANAGLYSTYFLKTKQTCENN